MKKPIQKIYNHFLKTINLSLYYIIKSKEFLSVLNNIEIRKKIFEIVLKNPGLHVKKISEILKISGQLADYHLFYLERYEIVTAIKKAGYKRYYIRGKLGSKERKLLSLLRQEIPLKIILILLKKPYARHQEILCSLDVTASTLSYHIKKLIDNNVLYSKIINKKIRYIIKNKNEILQLLSKYKPYSWINNFEDFWTGFT
jgi:predicted transcriptional regulator